MKRRAFFGAALATSIFIYKETKESLDLSEGFVSDSSEYLIKLEKEAFKNNLKLEIPKGTYGLSKELKIRVPIINGNGSEIVAITNTASINFTYEKSTVEVSNLRYDSNFLSSGLRFEKVSEVKIKNCCFPHIKNNLLNSNRSLSVSIENTIFNESLIKNELKKIA